MNPHPIQPTALIAEDEPLLAQALHNALTQLWPDLNIVAIVGDGVSAVQQSLKLQPDILFFDIQMPGLTGLEAAAELADQWNTQAKVFPELIFVTAYDQYAIHAFDAHALDYVLKPIQPQRLQKTIEKLQTQLARVFNNPALELEHTLAQLRQLLVNKPQSATLNAKPSTLKVLQASVLSSKGSALRMVPIDEVVYFDAADKYTRVITSTAGTPQEYLLRTPLKTLVTQLDPDIFWQIHRSTVVCSSRITTVVRDDLGKIQLHLKGSNDTLTVSRLYAHLFKAM